MLERDIEAALCDAAKAAGGHAYKFTSPGRRNVPDRIVIVPNKRWPSRPFIAFVELKRPGGKSTGGQLREHERLRALGCRVEVIDTLEGVAALFRSLS